MMDLVSEIRTTVGLFPAVSTTTPTVVVLDRLGSRATAFLVQVGVGGITFTGTNKLEIIVEDSDDNTNWAAVTTGNIRTSTGASQTVAAGGVLESYVAAKAAASTAEYGYYGSKRYLRITPTFGGTHATGTLVGVTFLSGELSYAP
jgi:hypothetical protein